MNVVECCWMSLNVAKVCYAQNFFTGDYKNWQEIFCKTFFTGDNKISQEIFCKTFSTGDNKNWQEIFCKTSFTGDNKTWQEIFCKTFFTGDNKISQELFCSLLAIITSLEYFGCLQGWLWIAYVEGFTNEKEEVHTRGRVSNFS